MYTAFLTHLVVFRLSFLKCSSFAKIEESFLCNFWNSFLVFLSASLLQSKITTRFYLISLFEIGCSCFCCVSLLVSLSFHLTLLSEQHISRAHHLFHFTGLHACALHHSSASFSFPIIHLLPLMFSTRPHHLQWNALHFHTWLPHSVSQKWMNEPEPLLAFVASKYLLFLWQDAIIPMPPTPPWRIIMCTVAQYI